MSFYFWYKHVFFITKDLLWRSGDENNNIIEDASLNTLCDILIKKSHKW
jgi:hypothetical protein